MRNRITLSACALAAAGAIAGPAAAATQPVSIQFAAVAGSSPVACGAPIAGLGTTGATAQLQDLRFYVSNVNLVRRNGSVAPVRLAASPYNLTAQGNRTTLIDLENGRGACTQGDAATNAVVRGSVPRGEYVGMRMFVGVPFVLNHSDTTTAASPLDSVAMNWSWQAGRKFTKIEVTDPAGPGGTWRARTFNVHLGSTGCTGNPATGGTASCLASNRVTVRMDRFDARTQRVAVDLQALLAGNDVTVNRAGAPGCMAGPTDPECAGVFAAFGLDWRPDGTGTGQVVDRGARQTVFRAVSR